MFVPIPKMNQLGARRVFLGALYVVGISSILFGYVEMFIANLTIDIHIVMLKDLNVNMLTGFSMKSQTPLVSWFVPLFFV